MTEEQWQEYISEHKGVQGQPYVVDPTIPDPSGGLGRVNNPNPRRRYTMGDGATITLQQPQPSGEGPPEGYIIVSQTKAPKTSAPKGPTTRVVNGITYQYDPTSNAFVPAAGLPQATPKQVPGRQIKADDGTIYTVGPDGKSLIELEKGQNLGKQRADASTSNAATAADRAAEAAKNDATKNGIAQQNANTAALKATYQGQVAQARQEYLDGKLSLAEFQAQVTELHQQATEALTARSQDLNTAVSAANDQATADREWALNSVPAGGNQVMIDVLNKEGAPAGIKLSNAQPTPYPRPDINAMIDDSLKRLQASMPFAASSAGMPPGVANGSSGSGGAVPATAAGFVAPRFSAPANGAAANFVAPRVPAAGGVASTPGVGAPPPTWQPRFGQTGPQ